MRASASTAMSPRVSHAKTGSSARRPTRATTRAYASAARTIRVLGPTPVSSLWTRAFLPYKHGHARHFFANRERAWMIRAGTGNRMFDNSLQRGLKDEPALRDFATTEVPCARITRNGAVAAFLLWIEGFSSPFLPRLVLISPPKCRYSRRHSGFRSGLVFAESRSLDPPVRPVDGR